MAPGEKIRRRRIELGYSLEALAEVVRTSKGHLCEIQNGGTRPNVETALNIARALGTSVEALWGSEADLAPVKPEVALSYRLNKAAREAAALLNAALTPMEGI
jgi:putative transcriptional regulator